MHQSDGLFFFARAPEISCLVLFVILLLCFSAKRGLEGGREGRPQGEVESPIKSNFKKNPIVFDPPSYYLVFLLPLPSFSPFELQLYFIMNKAKGFFNKMGLSGSDAPSTNSAIMKESKNRYGMGLGNTPAGVMPVSTASNATPGYLGQWGEVRAILCLSCMFFFPIC